MLFALAYMIVRFVQLGQDRTQVPLTIDEQVIEALTA
jgi:hypothetical protein